MKAWIAGIIVVWMVALGGLVAFGQWELSPVERIVLRPELEAEVAAAVPNPLLFGRPLLHFYVTAPWLDPDHRVRWHTLPAGVVWQALHRFFPTPLLARLTRIAVIAAFQAIIAAGVLWIAIQGASRGSEGPGRTPLAPLGRDPGGRW